MNIGALKELICQGESEILEFKKSTAKIRAAFETITAFLNGKGGIVLIGVTDNGKVIGQEISDATKREIANEVAKVEPTIRPEIHYVGINDNKFVIVIGVKRGQHTPYTYDGKAFQRNQSTTEKISQHRYEQLLIERGQLNHAWEDAIAEKYSIDDLNHDQIYQAVSEAVRQRRLPASALQSSVEDILIRYKLMDSEKLKNAAIALFAKEGRLNLTQCILKMARFKGDDKLGTILDNKQVVTNAFSILDEVDAFLNKHLSIMSFFEKNQFQRIDKPTLPVLAIREAIVNAICHHDYSDYTGAIELAIYDNKLEIWNNGSLPSHITVEDLSREHHSWTRNKLIAGVFYTVGLIETWGTGTNRMIQLCEDENLPVPTFKEEFGGISVVFEFKTSLGVKEVLPNKISEMDKRQKQILEIIRKYGEISMDRIVSELDDPPSRRTLQKDLNQLKNTGKIELWGAGRGAVWKYIP